MNHVEGESEMSLQKRWERVESMRNGGGSTDEKCIAIRKCEEMVEQYVGGGRLWWWCLVFGGMGLRMAVKSHPRVR